MTFLICDQPSLSGSVVVSLTGHVLSGLTAFQARSMAASALSALTSTSAMREPPSGGSRKVAGPSTDMLQPAGATKVLPATVAFGVSSASFSGAGRSAGGVVAAGAGSTAVAGGAAVVGAGFGAVEEEHAARRSTLARALDMRRSLLQFRNR